MQADVADREHAPVRRTQVVVDRNAVVRFEAHSGGVEVQPLDVGVSPGREKNRVGDERMRLVPRGNIHLHFRLAPFEPRAEAAVGVGFKADEFQCRPDFHAVALECFLHNLDSRVPFAWQELPAFSHESDLRSEPRESLGQFAPGRVRRRSRGVVSEVP